VPRAVSGGFPGDHERQQLSTRQWLTEQTVDYKGATDRTRGAGKHRSS
jgi:hypothetical protein